MIKDWLRGAFFLPSLLGAGIVTMLLVIGVETDWGSNTRMRAVPKKMAAAKVADAGLLPAVAPAEIEQAYPESAARPLFLPARRPIPPAPVQQQVVNVMRKGQFLLQGTSVTKALGDVVLLREVATNKTLVVRKGEKINDITVEKIEPGHIVLKQEAETEDLDMRTQGSPKNQQPAQTQQFPQGSIFPQPNAPGMIPTTQYPTGPFMPAGMQPPPQTSPPAPPIPSPGMAQPQHPGITQNAAPQPTPEEILARRRAARASQSP